MGGRRLFTLALLIFFAVVPSALANQGGWHTGTGWNGDRGNLKGSATVPSTGGVIATVSMQSCTCVGAGLVQAGEIKEGSSLTTDCGTGTIGYIFEKANVNGMLSCNPMFGTFGSDHRFANVRKAGTSGTWNEYVDGVVFITYTLNWGQGNAYARAEYNGSAPNAFSFTWGPSGETPWQNTNDSGSSYHTIGTEAVQFNDGGWLFTNSPPSPFTVFR
jgi:hypothetical protein